MDAATTRRLDEIEEELSTLRLHWGETEAQAASETSLFGDAWVGAADQLAAFPAAEAELLAERAALLPPVVEAEAEAVAVDPEDIPF